MSFGGVIPVTGLNLGFAGQITRLDDFIITARPVLPAATENINFGDPVVIIPNATGGNDSYRSVAGFIAGGGTFTAARFAGVCNREVKTTLAYTSLGNNGTTQLGYYAPGEMCEAVERSSVLIHMNIVPTNSLSQGPVYVRTVANGTFPAGVVGGFEGVADGSNTVLLTNVVLRTGIIDANGMAEITLLNRVAA